MSEFVLHLPYPPSVNHYWLRNRNGSVRVGDAGSAYRIGVDVACRQQCKGKRAAYAGRLTVEIDVYPPDRRRRDLDNTLKATLDALKHAGVYEDDSQVDVLSVRRHPSTAGGALVVTIREMGAESKTGT